MCPAEFTQRCTDFMTSAVHVVKLCGPGSRFEVWRSRSANCNKKPSWPRKQWRNRSRSRGIPSELNVIIGGAEMLGSMKF